MHLLDRTDHVCELSLDRCRAISLFATSAAPSRDPELPNARLPMSRAHVCPDDDCSAFLRRSRFCSPAVVVACVLLTCCPELSEPLGFSARGSRHAGKSSSTFNLRCQQPRLAPSLGSRRPRTLHRALVWSPSSYGHAHAHAAHADVPRAGPERVLAATQRLQRPVLPALAVVVIELRFTVVVVARMGSAWYRLVVRHVRLRRAS